jgi:hypothetical protein
MRIPKEFSRALKTLGFKWKMVLNENKSRFTVFVKKNVINPSLKELLYEPFRLDLNLIFADKNSKKRESDNTFFVDPLIKAVLRKSENEKIIDPFNQSSLVSIDKNCSVLSLNFTSDSFYQSHSREEWMEKGTKTNPEISDEPPQKDAWINRFQMGSESNQISLKKAIRVKSFRIFEDSETKTTLYK